MSDATPHRAEPTRTDKPWGYELLWAHTTRYVGKVLVVYAGHALSLQFHRRKEETLMVLSGEAQLEFFAADEPVRTVHLGRYQVFHITPGLRHRLTALTACELVEVSTPELDDVVRLADRYGRADETT